jgi:CRP/FNR family transcriptional regulator, anaerobic regulatory protein
MSATQLAPTISQPPLANVVLFPQAPGLASLLWAQRTESFAAGETIFWEGDASSHVFHLTKGCLRLCRLLPDGRRAVMGFVFAGEMLGISLPKTYLYTAEAIGEVCLRRMPRLRFHQAVDASETLRPLLLAKMYEDMSAAQQHMLVLSRLSAEERVVNFLLSAARRTGVDLDRPVVIELPMSRLDIGDYLGLTIETVSREISKLRREGQIACEGRRIVLRRMEALQGIAGGLADEGEPDLPVSVGRMSGRAH